MEKPLDRNDPTDIRNYEFTNSNGIEFSMETKLKIVKAFSIGLGIPPDDPRLNRPIPKLSFKQKVIDFLHRY